MSAFLGKIHYWLYNKIVWHEGILEEILNLAESKGVNTAEIKDSIYSKYGEPDIRPLEEVIDHANIHGWLQSRIQSVEYRIAAAVTELLDKGLVKIEELEELYRENGIKAAKLEERKITAPRELFDAIFDFQLAGMPCDRVHETVADTEAEFAWQTSRCLHKEYWDAVGENIYYYYLLQDAWIKGYIEAADTRYSYTRNDDGLRIIKKG